jgi:hypothetical protein
MVRRNLTAEAPAAAAAAGGPATVQVNKSLYHCRCYNLGDTYEMWVLDPASGTYNGPIPCTQQQCQKCNMSAAALA